MGLPWSLPLSPGELWYGPASCESGESCIRPTGVLQVKEANLLLSPSSVNSHVPWAGQSEPAPLREGHYAIPQEKVMCVGECPSSQKSKVLTLQMQKKDSTLCKTHTLPIHRHQTFPTVTAIGFWWAQFPFLPFFLLCFNENVLSVYTVLGVGPFQQNIIKSQKILKKLRFYKGRVHTHR